MTPLDTIIDRLSAWKDVNREKIERRDSFLVRGQIFAFLGRKGIIVKLAPPQVSEALKIKDAKRIKTGQETDAREFVQIPVSSPREVERAMLWLRRACRLGRSAAGPI